MFRVSDCVRNLFLVLAMLFVLSGSACSVLTDAPLSNTPSARRVEAADAALEYILAQQADDGSLAGDVGITLDAILAGAAAGDDVSGWRTAEGKPNPLEYVSANWEEYAENAAGTGKLVAALVAARRDPREFAGQDFVQHLLSLDTGDGSLGDSATGQAWAMLGLAASGEPVTEELVATLVDLQQSNGGWEFAPDSGTDSNTTALALQALVAADVDVDDVSVVNGLDFLANQQTGTGGFVYSTDWGSEADANSTAYCLQALIATGEDPESAEWVEDSNSALDALLDFQLPSGAFEWQPGEGENLLATAQAVPALLGKPFPDVQ